MSIYFLIFNWNFYQLRQFIFLIKSIEDLASYFAPYRQMGLEGLPNVIITFNIPVDADRLISFLNY